MPDPLPLVLPAGTESVSPEGYVFKALDEPRLGSPYWPHGNGEYYWANWSLDGTAPVLQPTRCHASEIVWPTPAPAEAASEGGGPSRLDLELERIESAVMDEQRSSGAPRTPWARRRALYEAGRASLAKPRPLDEWHEDMGVALWWFFPVQEPPYVGSPLDCDWPGCHTHWTPIVEPPRELSAGGTKGTGT